MTARNTRSSRKKVVLLFSGGLDSTLSFMLLADQGLDVAGLSILYPGRPVGEIASAKSLVHRLHFSEFYEVSINGVTPFPRGVSYPGTPDGWFPFRNLLFWAIGVHKASADNADYVAGGHDRDDGQVFSDASREFFDLLAQLLKYSGNQASYRLELLLPMLSKPEHDLHALAGTHRATVSMTWSCWKNTPLQCGQCMACVKREDFLRKVAIHSRSK